MMFYGIAALSRTAQNATVIVGQGGGMDMLVESRVFKHDIPYYEISTDVTHEKELVIKAKDDSGRKREYSFAEGVKRILPPGARILHVVNDYYHGVLKVYYTK